MLPVAILAGGLATRLRPITESIPKALVEVARKPFILWQLDYLRRQGIKKVVLCLGYLGEQVEKVVGDGSDFGLCVDYSYDGPNLLGTGGALKKALPLLGSTFFVFYGDSYLPINFSVIERYFFKQDKPALMTIFRNVNQWDKSNVSFSNNCLVEYNKYCLNKSMSYIDYGLGILTDVALTGVVSPNSFDLANVYHCLSVSNRLAGYEVFERFYEIGSYQGLAETNDFLEKELMS